MIGATLLAVTLVPVLCTVLVRGPFHAEGRNWLMRGLLAIYDPVLDWALRWRRTVIALAAALLAFCSLIAFGLPARISSLVTSLPSVVQATTEGQTSLPARLTRG